MHAAIHGKYVLHIENLPPVESMITPGPAHEPLKPDVFTAEKPPEGAPSGGRPKLTMATPVLGYLVRMVWIHVDLGPPSCLLASGPISCCTGISYRQWP